MARSTIGYYSNSWASCLLLSTATITQSKITAPSHGIALVGSSLSLTCSSDSSKDICWEYYASYESIPRTIYAGRYVNRQYSRTHNVTVSSDGSVSLTLMEVQLEDAGMYQCRECSTVQSADIEVVVLGKQLQISWNTKQCTRYSLWFQNAQYFSPLRFLALYKLPTYSLTYWKVERLGQ